MADPSLFTRLSANSSERSEKVFVKDFALSYPNSPYNPQQRTSSSVVAPWSAASRSRGVSRGLMAPSNSKAAVEITVQKPSLYLTDFFDNTSRGNYPLPSAQSARRSPSTGPASATASAQCTAQALGETFVQTHNSLKKRTRRMKGVPKAGGGATIGAFKAPLVLPVTTLSLPIRPPTPTDYSDIHG